MHSPLKKYAQNSILEFATHFRAREKFLRDVRNDDYLPTDCKITMKLQTTEAVEKGPGFKDLCRETQDIVNKCRQMLKLQHMKCIQMNVSEMEKNIPRTFATALPKVASLLLALELKGIEIASGHCAIADIQI